MLNTARAHHITLSSGRLYSPQLLLSHTLGFRHAGLHFLRTLSHPGAVGDVILRARYYAFISKYLDSTDLFLRRRRSSFFSRLLQASWLALVALPPLFFSSLRSHYPSLLSLLPLHSLLLSLHRTALLFLGTASPHFALALLCIAASHLPISSRGGGDSPNS